MYAVTTPTGRGESGKGDQNLSTLTTFRITEKTKIGVRAPNRGSASVRLGEVML